MIGLKWIFARTINNYPIHSIGLSLFVLSRKLRIFIQASYIEF